MMKNKKSALSGVRVIDLSRVLAGPYCSMILADLGAEVIKVEEPGRGDPSREYPPLLGGVSTYFANLNRNKKSIILDLKKQEAKDILRDLLKRSDVLLENFRPGKLAKLGFGYDQVKEINPRIVYASITGYGQYGPYKDRPGYDIIGQAMGGLMDTSGWPDSPPTRTGTAMADVLAGLNCSIGILAALKSREHTGVGDRIDVALVDSVVSSMENVVAGYQAHGILPRRSGNRYEFTAPMDSYDAADGWLVIGVAGDEVWKRLCKAMEREDLLNDPSLETNLARVKERDRLKVIITEWTSKRKIEDIVSRLANFGVPCAPIYNVDQVVNDPHIAKAREMIVEMKHPIDGKIKVIGSPIKISEMKPTIRTSAPLYGEHSEEIVTGILGLSHEDYIHLKERHAIG